MKRRIVLMIIVLGAAAVVGVGVFLAYIWFAGSDATPSTILS